MFSVKQILKNTVCFLFEMLHFFQCQTSHLHYDSSASRVAFRGACTGASVKSKSGPEQEWALPRTGWSLMPGG